MADVATATADAGTLVPVQEPALVLTDPKAFASFYDAIAMEARGLKANVATKRGRDAIASMAYKVARTKTAIDDAGKKLTEDARSRISTIDAARREIRVRLDALRDEVRAPLNAWEAAEEARLARVDAALNQIRDAARVRVDDTSQTIDERIASLDALVLEEDEFQGDLDRATTDRANALESLRTALQLAQRREAEQAELARLRAAEEARQAEERRLAAEAEARRQEEEARRQEAERQERERAAAEQAERERQEQVQRAAREAEERARRDAEAAARAAQEERERQHQEEVARERRAREEAEAAARREAQRREDEERARQEAAHREQKEAERRAADREHRGAVMRTAKEALMEHAGLDEDAAKKVVLAIASGSVPAVTIRF